MLVAIIGAVHLTVYRRLRAGLRAGTANTGTREKYQRAAFFEASIQHPESPADIIHQQCHVHVG